MSGSGWTPVNLAHIRRAVDAVAAAGLLSAGIDPSHDEMAAWLYGNWYAVRPELPASARAATSQVPRPGMLTAAHAGAIEWEEATVTRIGEAGLVVTKTADGNLRAIQRGDYASAVSSARIGLVPKIGDTVRVRRRGGCVTVDGWWQTWSGPRQASLTGQISRIYLTPQPDHLALAVVGATTTLQARTQTDGLHWTLKVGTHPGALARPDAMVVYLGDDAVIDAAERLAQRLCDDSPGVLAAVSPPFTRVVAPGIAWANDPHDEHSFGEAVCHMMARALLQIRHNSEAAAREGAAGPELTVIDVARALREHGLGPNRAHLRTSPDLAIAS